jgi:benzylsuccinate CoA-transferase BbsF subunit
MLEATLCGLPESLMELAMNGRRPTRRGNADRVAAPHGVYRCRGEDAWVAIAVGEPAEWEALARSLGRPDLADDPRFADAAARKRNEAALDGLIAAWTAERTVDDVVAALQAAGVPSGPVLSPARVLEDPHLRARGVFVETEAPLGGRRLTIGASWRISPDFDPTLTPAPRLGQDDDYVFKQLLGLSDAELAGLRESKVVF